jgi:hypothetical protein
MDYFLLPVDEDRIDMEKHPFGHSYYLTMDYWPSSVSLKRMKNKISEYGLYTNGNHIPR